MPDIPDFTFKGGTFPMASVIEASQRKAQMEQQANAQNTQMTLQGIDAIGQIGQTLTAKRMKVANALALKKTLIPEMPDDVAKNMEPEQILKAATIKSGAGSPLFMLLGMHPELMKDPSFLAAFAAGSGNHPPLATTSSPPVVPSSSTATSAPAEAPDAPNGAILTSNTTQTPVAPPAPSSPVPIPAPPSAPAADPAANPFGVLNQPMTKGQMNSMKMGLANRPQAVFSYDNDGKLTPAGQVPKGSIIKREIPGPDNSQEGEKEQNRMEGKLKDSMSILERNSRGEYGIEDRKVGQARHLRQLLNKAYDPKTGQYNLPSSLYNDLALGMATLASPTASPGVELLNALRQGTLKGDIGQMLTYATGTPWNGSTQDILNLVRGNIDRQGETSEDNRNYIWESNKQINSIGLNPDRYKKYENIKPKLDYRSIYDASPDKKSESAAGGLSPQEQKFIDNYEAKHKLKT